MTLRFAGAADAEAIFKSLVPMYDECGIGRLDPDKALVSIRGVLRDGAVMLAEKGGAIVGSLALMPADYWYGPDLYFFDVWFFVSADHRDGEAYQILLDGAARLSDETKLAVLLTVNNPRRRRLPHTRAERVGASMRYLPNGMALQIGGVPKP